MSYLWMLENDGGNAFVFHRHNGLNDSFVSCCNEILCRAYQQHDMYLKFSLISRF